MSDYTPPIEQVRQLYANSMDPAGFDRMIAQVRAEALREAAEDLNNEFQDIPAWLEAYREGVRTNEWMAGGVRMVLSAVEVLRDRADRIEREAGLK